MTYNAAADPVLVRLSLALAGADVIPPKRSRIAVHTSSKKHDFGTPPAIFDPLNAEFGFDCDAAATAKNTKVPRFISPEDNALIVAWRDFGSRFFLNPPYGRALPKFLRKVVAELHEGALTVTLTPARMDTAWMQSEIFENAAECWFVRGRIVFDGAPLGKDGRRLGAPFPSLISVFDPERIGHGPRFFTWDPASGNPRKEIVCVTRP